jgi:hypothetical protein
MINQEQNAILSIYIPRDPLLCRDLQPRLVLDHRHLDHHHLDQDNINKIYFGYGYY